jgi:RNA polymerase sigma-70 factor (ECF subfamily)
VDYQSSRARFQNGKNLLNSLWRGLRRGLKKTVPPEGFMEFKDPDLSLVREIKSGTEKGFREFVARYRKPVFYTALDLSGDYEEAREISLDALTQVYLRIKGFKGECPFRTWLFKIIVNISRSYRRKKGFNSFLSFEQSEEEREHIVKAEDDIEGRMIDKEDMQALWNAQFDLTPRQRDVFVMRHIAGMNVSEIAGFLNCKEGGGHCKGTSLQGRKLS